MFAVRGLYSNGQVILKGELPLKPAEVIVVFPDIEDEVEEAEVSVEKKREIFEEFSGSVSRLIDVKAEKMEALDKKYESIN